LDAMVRAVQSGGQLLPQRKLYLRFLECHYELFFGYLGLFSTYRPYCPPHGEKILRTALAIILVITICMCFCGHRPHSKFKVVYYPLTY
jgi:hypothetical protein